jgi:hypothetical protein
MWFRRRSIPTRKSAIDAAIQEMAVEGIAPNASPEWVALEAATDACIAAGKTRAALGGYVPVGHPGHPSKWSTERQDALANADAEVTSTTDALRIATMAYRNRTATRSRGLPGQRA